MSNLSAKSNRSTVTTNTAALVDGWMQGTDSPVLKPVTEPIAPVVTSIDTSATAVFIESVSDYFTGDETLQEQLRLLSNAIKSGAGLDECDTALYAEIKLAIQAQKKARLDRQLEEVRQETVMQEAAHATRAKDRDAELTTFLEEQKTIQERNEIAHAAKMALLAPLTEAEKETIRQDATRLQLEAMATKVALQQAAEAGTKKSQQTALNRAVNQIAARVESMTELTEGGRMLLSESKTVKTTDYGGNEVTIDVQVS